MKYKSKIGIFHLERTGNILILEGGCEMIRVLTMLTHDDQTVENPIEVYKSNRHAKTQCWGFKDINISTEDAKELSKLIRADKKELYFESLVDNEKDAIKIAKVAIECNAEYLTAMEYFESVHAMLKAANVKFIPTCGIRKGVPRRMLYGTIDDIINHANEIAKHGVEGICLSVFRYVDGDPIELAKRFVKEVDAPLVVSGSINSDERLDFIKDVKPWGFTIGSALFDSDFGEDRSIVEKLDYVFEYINS